MKIAVLDRDGVINYDSDQYIKAPNEFQLIPGSIDAIINLKKHGYLVFIATNQAGIGRGLYSDKTLTLIHDKLKKILLAHQTKIDGILFCPHVPEDNCDCRKPKPGLFFNIMEQLNIDFKSPDVKVFAVGDSLRDLQAASQAGINKLCLVKTGKGMRSLAELSDNKNIDNLQINIYNNLLEACSAKNLSHI